MGRKFKDMETPEQAYARQTAPARADAASSRAVHHHRESRKAADRMSEMYYSGEAERQAGLASERRSPNAERHLREANRHHDAAERAREEARQAEAEAQPKKRRSWFW